jgi:polar amino acid transport system substrate-binding protein
MVFSLSSSVHERLSIKDLAALRIGAISGYSYGKTFDDLASLGGGRALKIEVTSGEEALQQNIKKLSLGRLDGVVSSPEVFYWEASKQGLSADKFKVLAEMPENDAIYIAISPKSPNVERYKKILSAGIIRLEKSGKLSAIRGHYRASR